MEMIKYASNVARVTGDFRYLAKMSEKFDVKQVDIVVRKTLK